MFDHFFEKMAIFNCFKMVKNSHKRPQMILRGQKHYLQPI